MKFDLEEMFLTLLNKDRIKRALSGIFRLSMNEMQKEIDDANEDNRRQSRLITELQEKKAELENKNDSLSSDLLREQSGRRESESNLKESQRRFIEEQLKARELEGKLKQTHDELCLCSSELEDMKNSHLEEDRAFNAYSTLSPDLKSKLKNIFPYEEQDIFFVCGVQEERILMLHDFVIKEYRLGHVHSGEDTEKLQRIFLFFFGKINMLYDKARYKLLLSAAGEAFNPALHEQTGGGSSVRGNIVRMHFPGILRDGNIFKKSLVEIQ